MGQESKVTSHYYAKREKEEKEAEVGRSMWSASNPCPNNCPSPIPHPNPKLQDKAMKIIGEIEEKEAEAGRSTHKRTIPNPSLTPSLNPKSKSKPK